MSLRRGFKTGAAGLAREVRTELGLGLLDRFNPHQLAGHLDITVMSLRELAPDLPGVRHFLFEDQDAFSALTVFRGQRRLIVHNESHSEPRQNSNLTHELAHALLLHNPAPPLHKITGCRHWDGTNEEEANWLSGELLVTSEMALAVARGSFSKHQAQECFGVSKAMLLWRINATGAVKRVQRERARRKAHSSSAKP